MTHDEIVEAYRLIKERFKFSQRVFLAGVTVSAIAAAYAYFKIDEEVAELFWIAACFTLMLVWFVWGTVILRCPSCKKSLWRKTVDGEEGSELNPDLMVCHHCYVRLR